MREMMTKASNDSFIIVVYETIFYLWFEQKNLTDHSKNFSQTPL